MKAVGLKRAGGSDVLEDMELPSSGPGPRDLLVAVKAVSVNPIDTKLRARSKLKDGEIKILGFDAAGIVEAVGRDVELFRPGDAVFWLNPVSRQGANARYHVVDERVAGKMPATLSFAQAAALPLTTLTAWELLFEKLRVPHGEKRASGALLVINGAGGVGSILIQLAAKLTGLTVIATASRPETTEWVRAMGAHHVIDHHMPLNESIQQLGFKQIEFVAGLAATDQHLPAIAKLIAPHGHLALIDDPKVFDIVPLRTKAVTVSWEGVFVRSLFGTANMVTQHHILNEVADLIDAGILQTTLRRDFGPLNAVNLAAAHDYVESGSAIGKAVLSGAPDQVVLEKFHAIIAG